MLTFLNIAYSTARNLLRSRGWSFAAHVPLLSLLATLTFVTVSVQKPAPASPLLITELFYDTPAVDGEEEWVELANFGPQTIDLSVLRLGDEEEKGGGEGMLQFPPGARLDPNQVIVVAQTARGYFGLVGRYPDYEIVDTDPGVPDMVQDGVWASGSFALANDGDEVLLLNAQDEILDAVNYGDKTTFFTPAAPTAPTGQSIARFPASCDTNSAAEWHSTAAPTPGSLDSGGECSRALAPLDAIEPLLRIGQIQGAALTSPYENQHVTFDGIVTGIQEDQNSAGVIYYTLFVQDLPGQDDDDPRTSDGVAVFHGRRRPPYSPGDRVQVAGTVTEFYGLTEIDDRGLQIDLQSSGHPLPSPVVLPPPTTASQSDGNWEAYEGMLVALAQPAQVVGPTHSGCGFAVVDANRAQPLLPRRSADDQIPQPFLVLHRSDVDCTDLPPLKRGDGVSGISGPLTYHFDQFKIVLQEVSAVVVQAAPLPLPAPAHSPDAGQFTVATFNVNNFFDSQKDLSGSAEPVVSAADLRVKQRKLSAAIGETLGCPTLVALQEVENRPLLASLAAEMAPLCGFTYQIAHQESRDSRGLDLALLADPRRVSVLATSLHQGCTMLDTGLLDVGDDCPPAQHPLFGRPPLRIDLQIDGHPYVVINNHFKSKREGEEETAARRLEEARHVANLASELQAVDPQIALIVLGDFNDFELSPVLQELAAAGGLVNVLESVALPERYTYIFDGIPQLLDGILVAPPLLPDLAAVEIMHVNADYPVDFSSDISPSGLPFHASDHDVPIARFTIPGTAPSPTPEQPTPSSTSEQPAPSPSPSTVAPTATPDPTRQPEPPGGSSGLSWPMLLLAIPLLALAAWVVWRR